MTHHRLASLSIAAILLAVAGCGGNPASPGATTATGSPATTGSAATASPTRSLPAASTPDASSAIQALLDTSRVAYGAPGAMAVLRVDGQHWAATSGKADLAGTAITETTGFRIASITKPIVSTLVLRAVSRGELKLDDVVGTLLPGFLRTSPPVTVRQLLDHTSGVFDESNDGDPVKDIDKLTDPALKADAKSALQHYLAGERVIATDRMLVGLSETHDRYFAPGAGYHYSNTNYQLAAMVLAKVTGHPLADLLRTEIAEPLGLTHTTIAPPDTKSPEFRGYGTSTADNSLVDITDDLLAFGNGGNGGIISTPDELLTIMQAIVSGKLLPADLVTEMKTPNLNSYGLGLGSYSFTCGTFYGHEGGVNGTASIAIVSDSGDRGVVIALNARTGSDPHLPVLADSMLCAKR